MAAVSRGRQALMERDLQLRRSLRATELKVALCHEGRSPRDTTGQWCGVTRRAG